VDCTGRPVLPDSPLNNELRQFVRIQVAPRHGFEPRFTAPKAAVLPLDDRGKCGKACPLSVTQSRSRSKAEGGNQSK
jgi:hypothetical protein